MRRVFDALMPPGAVWQEKKGGSQDNLHQGMANNLQTVHDFIAQIAYVRNPSLTPVLADLEREFGVSPSDGASIAQRQAVLQWRIYSRGNKGQYWVLQNAINLAGFTGVNVIPNDPAVDPNPFIQGSAQMSCGSTNSYCGYYLGAAPPGGPYNAFCALYGGTLVVNGAQYVNNSKVVGCGSGLVFCHQIWPGLLNSNICGTYVYSQAQIVNYGPPQDYWKFPFVFFIGGTPTFDGAGHLTALTQCTIPRARMAEFITLVLHFKPIHTWAALVYTN